MSTLVKEQSTTVLDQVSYHRLKKMLSSPDKDNHQVAYELLEGINVKDCLLWSLLIAKHFGLKDAAAFTKECPKFVKKLSAAGFAIEQDQLAYMKIYARAQTDKLPKELLQCILDEFRDDLMPLVRNLGFDFIDPKVCDIQFKLK